MTEGPQTSAIYCGDCLTIIPFVIVKQLIDRDFRKELEYVQMTGG